MNKKERGLIAAFLRFLKSLLNSSDPQPEPDSEPAPEPEPITGKKHALCCGINDYQGSGNDLSGCVNDAQDWQKLFLETFSFDSTDLIIDSAVTKEEFKHRIKLLMDKCMPSDLAVITYSGHGSYVVDAQYGDEKDGKDETLYLYDGHLKDDEIREILAGVAEGVHLVVISDSCHSGTVTRAVSEGVPRFMPPEEVDATRGMSVRHKAWGDEDEMKELLLTGCDSDEYSYDARIDGKFVGAMSYYAKRAMRANPEATWAEFYEELRKSLPSGQYPQTPQLEGSSVNKKRKLFN